MKRSRVQVSSKLVNNGPFRDVIPDRKHQRQCQCQHLSSLVLHLFSWCCGYLQNTDAFNDEEIRTKRSTQWDWLNLNTFKHNFVFILLNHKRTIYLLPSLPSLYWRSREGFFLFYTFTGQIPCASETEDLTWPAPGGCWWPPSAAEWRSPCPAAWRHILPPPAPYIAPGSRIWQDHTEKWFPHMMRWLGRKKQFCWFLSFIITVWQEEWPSLCCSQSDWSVSRQLAARTAAI